jgi:IS5 family transposase
MIGSTSRQASLFFVAFAREASLIKDDLLEPIDALLDDAVLVALVRSALGKRSKNASRTGRRGIAPDRLLRLLVLKQIKGWSFRELEREVRASLVYRRFCRFDHDRVPDHSNLSRNATCVPAELLTEIIARTVTLGCDAGVTAGRKLRTDTTVVETNVHYPTDSTLIRDGMRVLGRILGRIKTQCKDGALMVRDRTRSVQHRVLEIHRAAKVAREDNKQRLKASYAKLLAISGVVTRQSRAVINDMKNAKLKFKADASAVSLSRDLVELEHFLPLVERVQAQTKARVFGGNTHFDGKLLSLFETHTQSIRKGKAHKPTEFGRLVRVDEVEGGIVSNIEVCDGNTSDSLQWEPALQRHVQLFARAPRLATGDRGFFSAKNERCAEEIGVKRVVLPARGPLNPKRKKHQKQRWFREGLRFRAGVESRIATLKHRFDLERARYKGDAGFHRYVAWGAIANNLVSIARGQKKKKNAQHKVRTRSQPRKKTR